MEQLVNDIFGSWAGVVLSAMGLCAAVCALLPAPAEDSNAVYRVVYKILNWIGCNVKKAANADDTAQKKA
jgi:hypothetical protein